MNTAYDENYELSDREIAFKNLDQSRLIWLGDIRCYEVFKTSQVEGYWVTCGGDFVSHHMENPLPRDG